MMIYNSIIYQNSIKKISEHFKKNKSTVLVTGASGLIGSCLVDVLLEADFNVYALDLNFDRLVERFGQENNRLHFIVQNVCEPLRTEVIFDYIIHAASFADPKSYALYPTETILVNVLGAKNMLDYAKKCSKTRVMVTSTFEVYGKLDKDEYSEEDYGLLDYNSLRSCYPESKRTTENLLRSYVDEYNIDGIIIRFSSIYGPTMLKNDSKAHAQFLYKGINKENIVLKSEGNQIRTYTYVMDAVYGLLYVLFNGKTGEAYNIANHNSIISIKELAKEIANLCGTKVVFDLPDDIEKKGFSKPQNCILKTDKIEKLGWNANYNIKDGLIETIEIMKEMLELC